MKRWLLVLPMLAASMLAASMLAAAEIPLFNGKDLSGWSRIPRHEGASTGEKPGFVVRDGLLISIPDAPEDDLWYTREKIGNATLRVVFKVSAPAANSGIFTRIPVQPKSEDDAINKGIEVQIQETGDEYHCTGVLYDGVAAVPPKHGQFEPDRGPRPDTGYIAVQHHGGADTVWFREITLIR